MNRNRIVCSANGFALTACLFAAVAVPLRADSYQVRNLVSDGTIPADHTDPNLVNGWGIVINPAPGGFWWLSANGTGLSTLYDNNGVPQSLVVTVPPPGGSTDTAAPTGIVLNTTGEFIVSDGTHSGSAIFIFCTEEGTISGWAPAVPPPAPSTQAFVAVDNSSKGAIYKGLALASTAGGNHLFAADFHNARIDVFDNAFKPVTLAAGAFTDPNLPAGFSPYNVATIGDHLFLAYAKQDSEAKDNEPGAGNGFIDEFDTNGTLIRRFASGGTLSSPWGIVQAPADFGPFGGALLVNNFDDGRINAFDFTSGTFLGQLSDAAGAPIEIDGLWGISFGSGAAANDLYFSAGPDGEQHGLFGRISVLRPLAPQRGLCGLGTLYAVGASLLGLASMAFVSNRRSRIRP